MLNIFLSTFNLFYTLLICLRNVIFCTERRKEEDYDEEVEEDLQDEVYFCLFASDLFDDCCYFYCYFS